MEKLLNDLADRKDVSTDKQPDKREPTFNSKVLNQQHFEKNKINEDISNKSAKSMALGKILRYPKLLDHENISDKYNNNLLKQIDEKNSLISNERQSHFG